MKKSPIILIFIFLRFYFPKSKNFPTVGFARGYDWSWFRVILFDSRSTNQRRSFPTAPKFNNRAKNRKIAKIREIWKVGEK